MKDGDFEIKILGSGSAMPTAGHSQPLQAIRYKKSWFVVDCGDGAMTRLAAAGVPLQKIDAVFITHCHFDHSCGLAGLLAGMHLAGRTDPVKIYGPYGTSKAADIPPDKAERTGVSITKDLWGFPFTVDQVDPRSKTTEAEFAGFKISAFPLKHLKPCIGWMFEETPPSVGIDSEAVRRLGIPDSDIYGIVNGRDWTAPDGTLHSWYSLVKRKCQLLHSWAYVSDTAYFPELADYVRGAEYLYHEATFSEKDYALAKTHSHSTGKSAALTARDAGVKKLLLGHVSARYKDGSDILEEARSVFPDTELASDNSSYSWMSPEISDMALP